MAIADRCERDCCVQRQFSVYPAVVPPSCGGCSTCHPTAADNWAPAERTALWRLLEDAYPPRPVAEPGQGYLELHRYMAHRGFYATDGGPVKS